jgi:hypothetical protein
MGRSPRRDDDRIAAADPPADAAMRGGFGGAAAPLVLALVLALLLVGALALRSAGPYARLERDHDELMVSRTAKARTTLTVLFVGNSLTFRNDLAATLVDLASSDAGNPVRLQVKAVTYPDASLDQMFDRGQALGWAREHRPNYVVLQEHSFWYDGDYEAAYAAAGRWTDELRPLGATPVLFEVWTDGEGSDVFKGGSTPADDAQSAAEGTQRLAGRLGLSVAAVGQAFEAARRTPGAPDLYGSDHHHPSVAGTYLAALVYYRFFTGRTGAEATWRPPGLSRADAALLVKLNGG